MSDINSILPVTTSPSHYLSDVLNQATDQIRLYGENVKRNMFAIAYTINRVNELGAYRGDGFKSVHEWTEDAFGYKKSMSYNLLSIGKEYTLQMNTDDGTTVYVSNLAATPLTEDFTAMQITKMLPLTHDVASELVSAGEITPDMTVRDIQAVVKRHRSKDTTDTTTDSPDATTTPDTTEVTATTPRNKKLAKISTEDLINELLFRGYRVLDTDGNEYTPD